MTGGEVMVTGGGVMVTIDRVMVVLSSRKWRVLNKSSGQASITGIAKALYTTFLICMQQVSLT